MLMSVGFKLFIIRFVQGSRLAGKSRLMSECLKVTPKFIDIDQIVLTEKDKARISSISHLFLTFDAKRGML